MAYQHLAQLERYQIYTFRKSGMSHNRIAALLGRSPSTISRELRRNRGRRGYRPKMAHTLARRRAVRCRSRRRIGIGQWHGIESLLQQEWSPAQIAKRAELEGSLRISHEWIYQYIALDRAAGGRLWKHLRRANLRRRRYHRGRRERHLIRFRIGIEQRPEHVDNRQELGHWEGDTIVGKGHKGALVTLVERTSRLTRIGQLARADARHTADTIRNRLHQISARVKSITFDNGPEFALHQRLERSLSTRIFFAQPHKPWQRGSNENTNGLIRQYLPKSRPLDHLTPKEIAKIEKRLNNRPRKCLNYLTPLEVFNNTRYLLTVALRG